VGRSIAGASGLVAEQSKVVTGDGQMHYNLQLSMGAMGTGGFSGGLPTREKGQ